jgi:outer membrane protein
MLNIDLKAAPSNSVSVSKFLCCVFLYSSIVQAEDELEKQPERKHQSGFFYGAMLGLNNEIYKGVDNDFTAFPVIGYRSDRFNFLGPFISYRLLKYGYYELNSNMRYRFAGYDESDSEVFNGMHDRDASLDLGLGLSYKQENWAGKFDVLHDVIGTSNGFELNSSIGKTFYFGPIFIEPNLGLSYWNNQYVDYYYGVEAFEVNSNRQEYKGDYALNKNLGLNISTPIFFGGFTRLSLEQTFYGSSIKKSPLTDTDTSFSLRLTFSRFF